MKDLEHLVRYLDGELTEEEKQQLLDKLRIDPTLSEKLDLIKDVDKLIGDKHLASFEESLKEVENVYFDRNIEKTRVASRRNLIFARVAAFGLILIMSGLYYYLTVAHQYREPDKLFATYYNKLDADFITRSGSLENDDFINAIRLYNDNRYNEAIVIFRRIVKTDPSNNAAKLFLGICYTETNQLANATGLFKGIVNQKDPIFEEHAQWYLSLCYLKDKKPEEARSILKNLIQSDSFYKKKAYDILEQLR